MTSPMPDLPEPDEVPEAEWRPIFDRLGELLDQVAVALKGPTPPLTSWGYDDLPTLAAEAARARDQVRHVLGSGYACEVCREDDLRQAVGLDPTGRDHEHV